MPFDLPSLPAAPRRRRAAAMLLAPSLALLLAACGGGGGGGNNNAIEDRAARIEIEQTGLLLTGRGDSRALQARVFNAAGERLDLPVTWSSSDPSDIAIGSDGIARAERAVGSSQIVASIGALRSAPLLGVVTTVAEGTVLVDDEQILRGAVETDPEAEPSLDNTYTVVVSGISAPAVGTLMVGTGSQPLAGRVVSTREVTGGIEITLKLAPLPELFPQLEINQVFDLAQAPVEIPEEIAADYFVTRDGNTFSFTPRETTAKAVGAAAGTSTLARGCVTTIPNFREGSPLPISIPVAPALRITVNPSLDVLYTQARGLERLLVKATPTATIEGGLNVVAAFEGKIECKADLFVFRVPIGGALSFILSGLVPVGVSLEAGGKITVATMGISFKNETKFNARIGMECAGDCDFIGEVTDFTNVSTPKLDLPSIGDLRLEPSLLASATVSASLGNPFLRQLRFSSFEAKAGPRLLGSFAPLLTQVTDTTYKSNYRFIAEFRAGLGTGIQSVLNLLGIIKLTGLEFIVSTDLANSPIGTIEADRGEFRAGDVITFTTRLDAGKASFLGLYNVKEVLLARNRLGEVQIVGRVTAADGQTEFSLPFTAPNSGDSSEFLAFAVTRLLPLDLAALELDRARSTNRLPVAANDAFEIAANTAEPARLDVLANDSDPDQDSLRVTAVTAAARGVASIDTDGLGLRYRPDNGFFGVDRFSYTIDDGRGGTAQANVEINVKPPLTSTGEGGSIEVSASAGVCRDCQGPFVTSSEVQQFFEAGSTGGGLSRTHSAAEQNLSASSVAQGEFSIAPGNGGGSELILRCSDEGRGSGFSTPDSPTDAVQNTQASGRTQISASMIVAGTGQVPYSISVVPTLAASGDLQGLCCGGVTSRVNADVSLFGLGESVFYSFNADQSISFDGQGANETEDGAPSGFIELPPSGARITARLDCSSGGLSVPSGFQASNVGELRIRVGP